MDITKDDLQSMYIAEFLSIEKIAARIGRSKTYVRKLLTAYGIPMRTKSDYSAETPKPRVRTYGTGKCLFCGNETRPDKANPKEFLKFCSKECQQKFDTPKNLQSREYLYTERVEKQRSLESIAKENGCTVKTVKKWIEVHGIPALRLNESTANIRDIFTSREKLESMEIEARPPNAYERDFKRVSAGESEVVDFIKSIYPGTIHQCNRSILNGKELDIYIPEKNLAIEFDGVFYHSEVTKDRMYHLWKTDECAKQGIQLVHIYDLDWEDRKEIWKNFLRNKLSGSNRRIGARQCEVRDLTICEKNEFLSANHLQGSDKSLFKYGLYCGDELVAVMTFGIPRYNRDFDWELIRFAVKGGVSIPGGFSKLLKHFRSEHPGSIVSYANRLYSEGNVYRQNGFALLSTNPPRYSYFDSKRGQLIGRHKAVKRNLLKQFPESERQELSNLTETDLAHLLGYVKVWDCGTYTFMI